MSPAPVTDVHPVLGAGSTPVDAELGWNERLTLLYKQHAASARFLFKVIATFAFLTAAIALLALAA